MALGPSQLLCLAPSCPTDGSSGQNTSKAGTGMSKSASFAFEFPKDRSGIEGVLASATSKVTVSTTECACNLVSGWTWRGCSSSKAERLPETKVFAACKT